MGDPKGAPSSWLQKGPALTAAATLGSKPMDGRFCFSLSLLLCFNSAFHIRILTKKKRKKEKIDSIPFSPSGYLHQAHSTMRFQGLLSEPGSRVHLGYRKYWSPFQEHYRDFVSEMTTARGSGVFNSSSFSILPRDLGSPSRVMGNGAWELL